MLYGLLQIEISNKMFLSIEKSYMTITHMSSNAINTNHSSDKNYIICSRLLDRKNGEK